MRSAMEQQVQATAKNAPGTEQMTPEKKKMQQEFVDNYHADAARPGKKNDAISSTPAIKPASA